MYEMLNVLPQNVASVVTSEVGQRKKTGCRTYIAELRRVSTCDFFVGESSRSIHLYTFRSVASACWCFLRMPVVLGGSWCLMLG